MVNKIITNTGKEIDVDWCGISMVDDSFKIESIPDTLSLAEAFAIFSDPKETQVLTNLYEDVEFVYEGYIVLKGINMKSNGQVLVSLKQGVAA